MPFLLDENDIDQSPDLAAPGLPSGFVENLRSTFNEQTKVGNSISADSARNDAYADYLGQIETLTGVRLDPPQILFQNNFNRPYEAAEAEFEANVRKLQSKNPELVVKTAADINAEIGVDRAKQRADTAAVRARSNSISGGTGAFIGSLGGVLIDPPIAVSMLAGAPAAMRTAVTN